MAPQPIYPDEQEEELPVTARMLLDLMGGVYGVSALGIPGSHDFGSAHGAGQFPMNGMPNGLAELVCRKDKS